MFEPKKHTVMIKPFIAALALLGSGSAALAGPYANVEYNQGFVGTESLGSSTELHVGFEASNDNGGFYVQGGPAVLTENGGDSETELSGKVGGNVGLTEKLGAYGELAFITGDDDNSYGAKAGLKYTF